MKKIYLSLLLSAAGLAANAQLTQANHAPAAGDSYTLNTCTGTVTPGASGANTLYNFSSIALSSTITSYTGGNSASSTYTPANVAITANTGEISYYLGSSTDLKYYGGNILIGTVPATITYTSPAIYAKYPMNIGTSTTSAIGGSLSAFSNNGTFTGSTFVNADGTGTLSLPARTFTNVIRVVTSQTINFAVPAFGITNGVLNQVIYDYYVPQSKTPLFTINTSTASAPPILAASSQTALYVADNYQTVGVKENKANAISLVVFPNPSSNDITLFTESNKATTVEITDVTGKMISAYTFENNKVNFSTLEMVNGIYLYTVKNSTNQVIASGKFTVTH
jgi:hypothetical protein